VNRSPRMALVALVALVATGLAACGSDAEPG
jgi:predicted small secreted protein